MIKPYRIILILIFIFFVTNVASQSYSQNLLDIEKKMDTDDVNAAWNKLKKINESALSNSDKALFYYLKAKGFANIDKNDEAYKYYLNAKKIYSAIDSIDKAMAINLDIYSLITAQENYSDAYKKYFDDYLAYAKKKGNPLMLAQSYIVLGENNFENKNSKESITNFEKALALLLNIDDKKISTKVYGKIAGIYNEQLNKPDSALYYLNKQLDNIKEYGDKEELCYNYVNQAASYHYMERYDKAIEYLKKADSLPVNHYKTRTNQYIYEFLYKNYDAAGDYNNAYKYLQLTKNLSDSINIAEQNIAINDIHTKYRTKEKELENNLLKSQIKINKVMLYTTIGLLIAGFIIALLLINNSRRREKISRQEKLIEQQKLEKALKDYELHSIDMMLEGQEKERQRIANDLHDNLGSMLATLKLNFENLKLRKNELKDEENKLYDRTDELIEEAYQKVRRLAHAKNAGVFASEGLIPAIQKLADKISIPEKLKIQVIAFGFKERLENTLEIAIFRTVQELATNIIKHSKATEATIHLTDHEDNINIIIEDNGVGFDRKKIDTADGMGLQNIKKKIVQLGGNFEIDSTPGKGTTIIIDIPVND